MIMASLTHASPSLKAAHNHFCPIPCASEESGAGRGEPKPNDPFPPRSIKAENAGALGVQKYIGATQPPQSVRGTRKARQGHQVGIDNIPPSNAHPQVDTFRDMNAPVDSSGHLTAPVTPPGPRVRRVGQTSQRVALSAPP